jgi:hypothetical protein
MSAPGITSRRLSILKLEPEDMNRLNIRIPIPKALMLILCMASVKTLERVVVVARNRHSDRPCYPLLVL